MRYPAWRRRVAAQAARAQWLAAVADLNKPEPEWLYTDENIPMRNPNYTRGVKGGGNAA